MNTSTSDYYRIKFRLALLTDAHIGDGTRKFGGNVHGVRVDELGLPYLPDTQVSGLVRLAARRMSESVHALQSFYGANFGKPNATRRRWVFTGARYPSCLVDKLIIQGLVRRGDELLEEEGILTVQTHIQVDDNAGARLFAFQKIGGRDDQYRQFCGAAYSAERVTLDDVSYLVAAMRFDDRIGHRRTRGYGKVKWEIESIERQESTFTRIDRAWEQLVDNFLGTKLDTGESA